MDERTYLGGSHGGDLLRADRFHHDRLGHGYGRHDLEALYGLLHHFDLLE